MKRPRKPLTTAEISDRYRVHQRTVIRWIHEFGLPATRAAGRWRVEEADLEQFLTEARYQATGPVYVLVDVGGGGPPVLGRLIDYADVPAEGHRASAFGQSAFGQSASGQAVGGQPVGGSAAAQPAGDQRQRDQRDDHDQAAQAQAPVSHSASPAGAAVAAATMSVTTS